MLRALGWLAAIAALAGCIERGAIRGGSDEPLVRQPSPAPAVAAPVAPDGCEPDASGAIQETYLALVGRRPDIRELHAELASAERAPDAYRSDLARRLYATTEARAHLATLLLDWLEVPRVNDRERPSMEPCYGVAAGADDSGELAAFVRDRAPGAGAAPAAFTLRDLLLSSLALDDPTPLLRAHLIAQQAYPLWPANAGLEERERLRRRDFGARFLRVFLNRDLACLGCHNGEASVTWSSDPAKNRHFPLEASTERLLFEAPEGAPPDRVFAPFRYEGFVAASEDATALKPWGWSSACGAFHTAAASVLDDDALLASVRGPNASVLDVEAALRAGFEALRGRTPDALAIDEPNEALAYQASAAFVEHVVRELLGARLTEAHHFSVTPDQRALLAELTARFIADRYSLRELLVHIVASPQFAYGSGPACNEQPIARIHRTGREETGPNVVRDALRPRSARVVLRALSDVLGWPEPALASFPHTEAEVALLRSLGTFMRHGEPGFRGFDMQALLALEERYGACHDPAAPSDRISALVSAAIDAEASAGSALQALEQRMTGAVEPRSEPLAAALAAIARVPLDATVTTDNASDVEATLRAACGVLQRSPRALTYGLTTPSEPLDPEVEQLLEAISTPR